MKAQFVSENMQKPFANDGNKPITGRYPLSNLNYECADKKRKLKRKKIKK